jgi:hypothetical protein
MFETAWLSPVPAHGRQVDALRLGYALYQCK